MVYNLLENLDSKISVGIIALAKIIRGSKIKSLTSADPRKSGKNTRIRDGKNIRLAITILWKFKREKMKLRVQIINNMRRFLV
jgi:hypothetical protein